MEKKKKIIIISAIIAAVILALIFIFCSISLEKNEGDNTGKIEIVPEEEISDVQLRETAVELYYIDKNNELVCELRKIDSKKLLEDPYVETMNMLQAGPQNEALHTAIPQGVKINKIERKGDCLTIDFSKEFVENQGEDLIIQGLVVNQIVNTMTQFKEINNVKFLIDGKSNVNFKNGNINFEQIFTRNI